MFFYSNENEQNGSSLANNDTIDDPNSNADIANTTEIKNDSLANRDEEEIPTADDNGAFKDYLTGLLIAIASALMMAVGFTFFNKLRAENYPSLNHIFSMIIVLFLPVFFPMQGVVRPILTEWLILIVAGIIAETGLLLFIRGLQLEQAGKVSVFFLAQVGLSFLLEIFMGNFGGFWGLTGAFVAISCVLMYCKEGRGKIKIRETFVEKEGYELNAF